jgi:hypothetical protein
MPLAMLLTASRVDWGGGWGGDARSSVWGGAGGRVGFSRAVGMPSTPAALESMFMIAAAISVAAVMGWRW